MKKHRSLALVLTLSAVIATGACKKEENINTSSTDTTETTSMATSTDTMATDTSATSTTATSTTGSAATTLSQQDQDFVMKAAQGGMAEVALGQMASTKATNADVKSFANRMVTDHGQANQELQQLATAKGVTLPADMGDEHKKASDHLSGLNGAEFDKMYMSHMVDDHDKDVSEFEKASQSAQDPDVKAWAAKTLPTLKEHQKMAKDVKGKLK